MDQEELEKLWAITIPLAPLDESPPGLTYKPLMESVGTVFVPPPADPDATVDPELDAAAESGDANVSHSTLFPGVTAHVNLLKPDAASEELASSAGYELREVIGQGGMGVVYRARQASLQRDVAIKTIKERGQGEPKFVSEARATGKLDHPNIVPVYDLGATSDGETILAMKLVEGASWKQVLHPKTPEAEERAKRYELEDHLETLVQVANAVSFAHSRDLVHCDLKPENVMLGDFGEVLVMDWGLAVDVSEEPDPNSLLVHKSMVTSPCGTPSYMPPELAAGEGKRITPRTDVYLLGSILVELLTGKPPHTGKKLTAVIYQAYLSAPPALPGVPEELRQIAIKALSRLPEDRYASVNEFRDAVRGFIKHRESLVISDAAAKRLERGRSTQDSAKAYEDYSAAIAGFEHARVLWAANHAAKEGLHASRLAYAEAALAHEDLRLAEAQLAQVESGDQAGALLTRVHAAKEERDRAARQALVLRYALLAAVCAIVTGLVIGFALVSAARDEAVANFERAEENAEEARSEFKRAEGERARAESAQQRAERELAGALTAQGTMLMTRERYARARETFLRAEALSKQTGLPTLSAELGRWEAERFAPGPLLRIPAPSKVTATAADDVTLWIGCEDGTLLECDLVQGAERSRRTIPGGAVSALHLHGTALLVGSGDGTLRKLVAGEERFSVKAHEGEVLAVLSYELSRDDFGVHVVSAGAEGTIRVWNLAGLEELFVMEHPEGPPPDLTVGWGGHGFSGSEDGRLNEWSFGLGKVWDSYPPRFTKQKSIRAVAKSNWQPPDLTKNSIPQVVTASAGIITLFEIEKQRVYLRKTIGGHRAPIEDLVWTADGAYFVSVSSDEELRVWTRTGEQVRQLDGAGRGPLVLTPRGFWLIARDNGDEGPAALVWDLGLAHHEPSGARRDNSALTLSVAPRAQPNLRDEPPKPPAVTAVAIAPDGLWVAGGTVEGGVHVFDSTSAKPIDTVRGHVGPIRALRFVAPDATGAPRLRSAGKDGSIREWDLTETSGLPVATWSSGLAEVSAVAWTPDGVLLGGPQGELVRLRDQLDGTAERSELPPAPAAVGALAVEDEAFVVGCLDGTVLGEGFRIAHPEPVTALALEPEGNTVLVGDIMGAIVRYALPSGERVGTFLAHSSRVTAVKFLGEGSAISVGEDGRACLWSLETFRESYLAPPGGPLADIAVSLDPLRVASASEDGVLLWNMRLTQRDDKPVASAERFLERGSLRAAVTLLEAQRARGEAVSPTTLARAYWGLDYPIAARRVLGETPAAERSVEHQILARAVEVSASNGSHLGTSFGRTRVLAPLTDQIMLSAGELGDYQVWDLRTGERLRTWGVHLSMRNLNGVSVTPDRQRIVGRDAWGVIRTWTPEGELIQEFKSKDARRVVALNDGLFVLRYREAERVNNDGTPQFSYDLGLDKTRIEAFGLDPEHDRFALAIDGGEVRVLRTSDGEQLHSLTPFEDGKEPAALSFTRGGEALFTFRHKTLRVVGLDGTVQDEVEADRERIYVAAIDPAGKRIGWVDEYGYVRVYDLAARRALVATRITEFPMQARFSSDGETFVVGCMRGTLYTFPVPDSE